MMSLVELVERWDAESERWGRLARSAWARKERSGRYDAAEAAYKACADELRAEIARADPGPVPHNGTDTSRAAAESITREVRASMHVQVMGVFGGVEGGLTCAQVEGLLPHGSHQGISARIRELVLAGCLVDSGVRRVNGSGRSARVYVSTGRGGCLG